MSDLTPDDTTPVEPPAEMQQVDTFDAPDAPAHPDDDFDAAAHVASLDLED